VLVQTIVFVEFDFIWPLECEPLLPYKLLGKQWVLTFCGICEVTQWVMLYIESNHELLRIATLWW
jgi:hypothetical protein